MQQIYRRTLMPKCYEITPNFFEIALRHGCFPLNLLNIFRNLFLRTPLTSCFRLQLELDFAAKAFCNIAVLILFNSQKINFNNLRCGSCFKYIFGYKVSNLTKKMYLLYAVSEKCLKSEFLLVCIFPYLN